jgi:hypothetical protein
MIELVAQGLSEFDSNMSYKPAKEYVCTVNSTTQKMETVNPLNSERYSLLKLSIEKSESQRLLKISLKF